MGCTYGKPVVTIMSAEALLSPPVFVSAYAAVTESRRLLVDRMRRAEDRCRSLAAGLLLRRAVLDAGLDPSCLERLKEGANGKPYLPGAPFFFSLSHSGPWAVCAVYGGEVGIDIEAAVSLSEAVKKRIFTEKERVFMQSPQAGEIAGRMPGVRTGEKNRENAAGICLWTVKESYLKMKGAGLSVDPVSVEAAPEALTASGAEFSVSCGKWPGEVSHAALVWCEGVPITVCTEERPGEISGPFRLEPEAAMVSGTGGRQRMGGGW